MATHVTHAGVHDHGFNNISTYGNLWRMAKEQRFVPAERERDLYELALKTSGAVQALRWTYLATGEGFIYSFNGPHSLFADTIRSLRSLALAHQLGHVLMGERDEKISLLRRLVEHARATAKWSVYYGTGRDLYDVRGRVAHESVFNVNDGSYRCPNSQQGYSPFTTWTRGLAWIMCGFAELLEWMASRPDDDLEKIGGREAIEAVMLNAATATAIFISNRRPPMAFRTGIPVHPISSDSVSISRVRRIRLTITNRSTARPRPSLRKGSFGLADFSRNATIPPHNDTGMPGLRSAKRSSPSLTLAPIRLTKGCFSIQFIIGRMAGTISAKAAACRAANRACGAIITCANSPCFSNALAKAAGTWRFLGRNPLT